MTRQRHTGEAFDELVTSWLDDRAYGPAADEVLDRVLARTSRTRPVPAWLLPDRWLPGPLALRMRQGSRLVPVLLLIGMLLLAVAVAVVLVAIGSQRRLPPPFGLAAPGSVTFISDGHIWTANRDGSRLLQVTFDPRTDGFPTFSRDGARIAFKRLPAPNSRVNWNEWGDVMVSDVDGGHPIVLDRDAHSPSPMSWSADGRFLVYSKTVDGLDQVIVAATDGTSTRQITSGSKANWGPALSPDGRTVAFAKGYPDVVGLYAIQVDGSSERRLTTYPIDAFDGAEWSLDGATLLYGAGDGDAGLEDLWVVGADAASERRIVGETGNDGGPTWSPDGRWIAYLNTVPSGRTRVMIAASDGSNPRQISEVGDWSYPYWSPDARHVLAVDGRLSGGGGPPIAAILDPFGTSPASSFALPGLTGEGPPDLPGWQRLAP